MNKAEARNLLAGELAPYRDWPYEQLCGMVDAPKRTFAMVAPSGTVYQIDIYAYWDGATHGDVRVTGCIDDGGWRAFFPLGDSFIKAADGSFVGE